MNIKTALCDDSVNALNKINTYLQQYELEHDADFEITMFSSGEELLSKCIPHCPYQLLFIDVEMAGKNGIETASAIREDGNTDLKIVFVSSYPEYMQDSFQVQAFYYLTKPVTYSDFADVLNRIIRAFENSRVMKLLLQEDGSERLINIQELLYIEAEKNSKNMLRFVTAGSEIRCHGIINDWKKELEPQHFVTPYRGFLVNLNHVRYICSNSLKLTGDREIPLSRRYEREIRSLFSKHLLTIYKS